MSEIEAEMPMHEEVAKYLEAASSIYMVETKAHADISSPEVKAKAAAAVQWCEHASAYALSVGGKPWRYLLVPHDEIDESRRLADFKPV